jgi:hypothetical protein|eukprot:COSAG01_NODE_3824_length_5658_cov_8.480482_2_plen_63_part_00
MPRRSVRRCFPPFLCHRLTEARLGHACACPETVLRIAKNTIHAHAATPYGGFHVVPLIMMPQ